MKTLTNTMAAMVFLAAMSSAAAFGQYWTPDYARERAANMRKFADETEASIPGLIDLGVSSAAMISGMTAANARAHARELERDADRWEREDRANRYSPSYEAGVPGLGTGNLAPRPANPYLSGQSSRAVAPYRGNWRPSNSARSQIAPARIYAVPGGMTPNAFLAPSHSSFANPFPCDCPQCRTARSRLK